MEFELQDVNEWGNDSEEEEPDPEVPRHILNRYQWEEWNNGQPSQEGFAPFGLFDGQAISGPPTMDQVWPFTPQFIGTDFKLPTDMGRALNSSQMSALKSELIKDVVFDRIPKGTGAFGTVWPVQAFYRPNDYIPWSSVKKKLRFGCKIIRHRMATKFTITNNLNEMRVLRYLRHENICNIAETVGIPDRITRFPYSVVCIFFELCDGNLAEFKSESAPPGYVDVDDMSLSLPENLSRHWFSQIVRALEYLHRNDVSHMDIKEANILYRKQQNPDSNTFENRFLWSIFKLADFGNSKIPGRIGNFEESMKFDIIDLVNTLIKSSVSEPKGMTSFEKVFIEYCETSTLKEEIPTDWQLLSKDMKDLCVQMNSVNKTLRTPNKGFTALDILNHSWLQSNDEPRTERFIVREDNVIQPNYIPQFTDYAT